MSAVELLSNGEAVFASLYLKNVTEGMDTMKLQCRGMYMYIYVQTTGAWYNSVSGHSKNIFIGLLIASVPTFVCIYM